MTASSTTLNVTVYGGDLTWHLRPYSSSATVTDVDNAASMFDGAAISETLVSNGGSFKLTIARDVALDKIYTKLVLHDNNGTLLDTFNGTMRDGGGVNTGEYHGRW